LLSNVTTTRTAALFVRSDCEHGGRADLAGDHRFRKASVDFFFPDSQDQIDPSFDFRSEASSPDRVRQRDDRYAHELIAPAQYTGILLSKAIVDGPGSKYTFAQRHRLYRLGVRRFFRLEERQLSLLTLGDCGAFNYVRSTRRENYGRGRVQAGPPRVVQGQRARARTGAEPVADQLAVDEERAAGAALVRWPLALGNERAMRDADRREVQHRAEVERETGAARMVAAGRID
jgi:hypothetical protein